jgi:arylformamidase
MKLLDISPRLSERLAVWPGDVPFQRTVSLGFETGDHLGLSSIHTTVHAGAHTDAPSHYASTGQGIEERSLERYFGRCEVMRVEVPHGHRITPGDLPRLPTEPRLLLATGTYPDPHTFNEDFAALSPELVDHLHAHGVQLVGIDTPSIDPCEDKALLSHNAIARHDMAILEGIVLADVPEGAYTLIALPLPIEGSDASPVRAVLVDPPVA